MKANQADYSVRRMCGLLGVSPSGYYGLGIVMLGGVVMLFLGLGAGLGSGVTNTISSSASVHPLSLPSDNFATVQTGGIPWDDDPEMVLDLGDEDADAAELDDELDDGPGGEGCR